MGILKLQKQTLFLMNPISPGRLIFLHLLQKKKQEGKDVKVKKKDTEEDSEEDEESEDESDEDDDEEEESDEDESEEDEIDEDDDEEEEESDEEDEITTSLTAKKQVRFKRMKEPIFKVCIIIINCLTCSDICP